MSLKQYVPASVRTALRPVLKVARKAIRGNSNDLYEGFVDGISDEGLMRGWVIDAQTRKGYLPVGLYIGDELIESGIAQYLRDDVSLSIGAQANCGFQFIIGDATHHSVIEKGGVLSVRTMTEPPFTIGEERFSADNTEPALSGNNIARLANLYKKETAALLDLLEDLPQEVKAPEPFVQAPLTNHSKMFSTDQLIPDIPVSGQSAYLDYVRYRYRMDESFQVEPGLESSDRYLYWYLTAYRGSEKRRVPLSAEDIAYLNEPLVMGGQKYSLTRAMWWRLFGRPDMLAKLNLNDRESLFDIAFWWAYQDCPHIYFEDCLIPDRFADLLRGIHPSRRMGAYPLSYFTERYFLSAPQLQFLKPGDPENRKLLALVILLNAATRPDLLRYVPFTILRSLLDAGEDGTSEFERFINAMLEKTAPEGEPHKHVALTKAHFAHVLRKQNYDLASYQFLTRTPDGHRFESASMPQPLEGEKVDVQLIGPLAKASGLGQATRLSASILRETGLSVRGVDFDLDNPAPEGFSSDTMIEDYGPAKVNIIHLNAESTPLAFAYQPDAFSDSYNIGYFFWELDQPANCHYLGMDLLDEIWVSTEYGVEIYQPYAGDTPVKNVGMCFESNDDISRDDARRYVNERFRFDDSNFVCLVAFDSFSFVQRKNPVSVLEAFQQAFEGVPEARLVVKTQNRDNVFDPIQVQIWERVEAIISSDNRIVVINETLPYRDLLRLKAGSDCYISLHKSEGWGFGMIEAMSLRVPVVCTAYSGNMDFCSPETAWLVDYEEVELKQGDYIFIRDGSKWAEPSVADAAKQLRAAYDDPAKRTAKADAAYQNIHENFSSKAIAKRYGSRLKEVLEGLKG